MIDSLDPTQVNWARTQFALTAMSYIAIAVSFVLAYIAYVVTRYGRRKTLRGRC